MTKKKVVKKRKSVAKPAPDVVADGDAPLPLAVNGVSGNRVSVAVGKTINIGNYESIRVEFGACMVVQDGDSFDEISDVCATYAWKNLNRMVKVIEHQLK